ncbi:unnamed protein product [Trichobilharzia szidati]|nr:unnamed protein product [Trichobilharzia szidati]
MQVVSHDKASSSPSLSSSSPAALSSSQMVITTPVTMTTAIHPGSPGFTLPPKIGTLIPNRIFVGGINSNTTEDELRTFFSTYGVIKDVKIINDKSAQSKGTYGFVTFENQEIAEKIIKNEAESLIFKDRKLNIGYAVRKQNVFSKQEMGNTYFLAHNVCPMTNGLSMFQMCPHECSFVAMNQPAIYYPTTSTTLLVPQCTPTIQELNTPLHVKYNNTHKPNPQCCFNSNLSNIPFMSYLCTHNMMSGQKPQLITNIGTTIPEVSPVVLQGITMNSNDQLLNNDLKNEPSTNSATPNVSNQLKTSEMNVNGLNESSFTTFPSTFVNSPSSIISSTEAPAFITSSQQKTFPPLTSPSAYSLPTINAYQNQNIPTTKYPCLCIKPEDAIRWTDVSQNPPTTYLCDTSLTKNYDNGQILVGTATTTNAPTAAPSPTTTTKTATHTDTCGIDNPALSNLPQHWNHLLSQSNQNQNAPIYSNQALATQMKSVVKQQQQSEISSDIFDKRIDITNSNNSQSESLLMKILPSYYAQNKEGSLINSQNNKNDDYGPVNCTNNSSNNNTINTERHNPLNNLWNIKPDNEDLQGKPHRIMSNKDNTDDMRYAKQNEKSDQLDCNTNTRVQMQDANKITPISCVDNFHEEQLSTDQNVEQNFYNLLKYFEELFGKQIDTNSQVEMNEKRTTSGNTSLQNFHLLNNPSNSNENENNISSHETCLGDINLLNDNNNNNNHHELGEKNSINSKSFLRKTINDTVNIKNKSYLNGSIEKMADNNSKRLTTPKTADTTTITMNSYNSYLLQKLKDESSKENQHNQTINGKKDNHSYKKFQLKSNTNPGKTSNISKSINNNNNGLTLKNPKRSSLKQ